MQYSLDDVDALNLLVAFQVAEGQLQEAVISLKYLIDLQPDISEHYNNLGFVWLQLGQLNEAIACFQTALQLNPYETQFLDHLLHQLTQEKQFDTVIAIAIHSLQVNPTWDQGYLYIGNALQQQGADPDAAKACLTGLLPERLVQQHCPDSSFTYLSSLSLPDTQVIHTAIYSGRTVNLVSPKTVDGTIHPAFLNCQVKTLPAYVVSVANGRVWADSYTRAILTSDNSLVEDASTGNAALIAASSKLPPPVPFQGTLACLTIRDSHNYFHWMYDLLPKFELLEKCNMAVSDIDAFLVNHCCYPFQRELLNLLGILDEKILDPSVYYGIADQLIVPISSPSFHTGRIPKQVCDFLRHKLLPVSTSAASQPARLYISRKGASYRKIQNEEEVVACLQQFGFEQVLLETLTVKEQISLFSTAEEIVSPHGAGLSNLVFCEPGTTLIEIFLPDDVLNYYWLISQYVGINYYYFIADPTEPFIQELGINQIVARYATMTDMVVSVEALLKTLRFAGIIS